MRRLCVPVSVFVCCGQLFSQQQRQQQGGDAAVAVVVVGGGVGIDERGG